jgi:transcription elongation factor GreA
MNSKTPLTKDGYESLKVELEILKKLLNEDNEEEIKRLYSSKDKARKRASDLEDGISNAAIVDSSKGDVYHIQFGCKVLLGDFDTAQEVWIRIVSSLESDQDKGMFAVESPLGKALLGKSIGDVVKVKEGARIKEYEVLEITG